MQNHNDDGCKEATNEGKESHVSRFMSYGENHRLVWPDEQAGGVNSNQSEQSNQEGSRLKPEHQAGKVAEVTGDQFGESNQEGCRLKPGHQAGKVAEVIGNQFGESNQEGSRLKPEHQAGKVAEVTGDQFGESNQEGSRLKPEHRAVKAEEVIGDQFGGSYQNGTNGLEFEVVEAWPEAVDGAALLDELEGVMRRFVVLPKYAAETLALWTLHTYAFQLREVSTYLGIESPEKRCGKTTLLSVLSELAHRTVAAANISSSAVFRVIEETQPTLLIDEADTFLQGNDELRGILNSGYTRKTAYVVRVAAKQVKSYECRVKNRDEPAVVEEKVSSNQSRQTKDQSSRSYGSRLVRFSCWCPKVMAAIGRLPDTLADRCIVIRMQRKMPGEECERLRFLESVDLKRKCVRFVQQHAEAISRARPSLPAGLNDRAGDIWEPLLALADIAGGEWPTKARVAAEGLAVRAQESNPAASLLYDILSMFLVLRTEKVFSRLLVERLNGLENRPWMEARNGKPITELWLAQQLRPYGIRSRSTRVGDAVAKGYAQEDFDEAFARYIPRAELETLLLDEPQTHGVSGQVDTK